VSAYDRRRKRRNPWRRRLAWAVAFALVFAIGIALGQALEDSPAPTSTVTQDRTFTLPPPAATVTVTAP
jgi:ferric-dicitrate binding protein FerR (iron transport regulator)